MCTLKFDKIYSSSGLFDLDELRLISLLMKGAKEDQ